MSDTKPVAAHVKLREESKFNADMCDSRDDREREAYYMRVIGACNTIDDLQADAKRLDWMQFHGAKVCWGNDSEYCDVQWSDREDNYRTNLFADWRQAIDAAMTEGKQP